MSCRIVEEPAGARPYAWRVVGGSAPANPPGGGESQAETPDQRRQLVDLERARQAELAQVREAAFREGQKKGREDAQAEVTECVGKLAATIAELATARRIIRNEAEGDVVRLSLAIARRILHRELAMDPSAIHGLVHAALEKLQNREIHRVRVHPAFVAAVRSALEALNAAPAIEVVPDPALRKGDALFETTLGELDASVETQLQEIERGFADRIGRR
jgi:flagellar assembly protein FliH